MIYSSIKTRQQARDYLASQGRGYYENHPITSMGKIKQFHARIDECARLIKNGCVSITKI